MSKFVDATMIFIDTLLQDSKRKGNFVEADPDDAATLRAELEKREALLKQLADALLMTQTPGVVEAALKAYEESK